ncbi:polyprenol monophosphomannose synthase [Polynucleobacter paneuropaeus]|uniref:Polyprenol monophosphomannose synthase n=1 Tax=Polynucleobacter paneuropaeus TaxID=2527775 RepID=A0ABX9FCG6_9BURK|nr:polyprenol monophosphomannose synthase [Polynucleobacter paneuropaeus]RAZ43938.1 polyprenol monophosphomannose synthase [Polynucleobacter paneuropaeus]
MNIAILIPTYNESLNVEITLNQISTVAKKLSRVNFLVIVIDDSSPDGTANLAQQVGETLKTSNFSVNILSRKKKEGLGKAYVEGFKYVFNLNQTFNYLIQMDADLSHQPKYIENLVLAAEGGADFVIGSRYIKGGSIPKWSWYRRLLSKFGNLYARTLLGSHISDYTGGFNLYSIALLKMINLDELHTKGYGFLISLKYQASVNTQNIVEIPIELIDREYGVSKMPLITILDNFILVLHIKIKRLFMV